ncbi:NAD-dependent epimerase/dehydratase family protein [Nonomuraea sp. NN258]|uniref:NAD-dependent epimerase/dehydratase family protein n=1 Tax=Nonomuraea antri TaxID=2730852 RepID=UPI001569B09B|nr:NAD-dependent epimerase/dehydratase family protein [Nonomuraea antri]NRQ32187.1 NAD-dependent epimerase/dehydratase family protein [Nonomuraea antri]
MRVLLAGATGAIGIPLLSALAAAGHEVIALVRDPAKERLVTERGAHALVADVLDGDGLLRAVEGQSADVVMHQATALRDAPRRLGPDDPTLALRDRGTAHLLRAAREVGARRFVTQSLITGYGYRDHGTRILTEDDDFGVHVGTVADLVTDSSVATERQVFAAAGIEGVALRYGMFYGRNAFSDMFAGMMRRRIPVLPRGATGTTSFVHVHDAAVAAVAAMERGRAGQAYNVVDDEPMSWRDFMTEVARAHGTPRPVAMPRWLIRAAVPYLGCLMIDTTMRISHAKATRELGWTPAHRGVRDGLRAR